MIGVHYPKPMVNHAEASRLNIERMKQIYQQLSCYRGLGKEAVKSNTEEVLLVSAGKALIPGFALSSGLLATVPSNSNGNRNSNNETCFPVEASHDPSTPSGKQSETMEPPRASAREACLNRKHLVLQVIRCPFTRRETGKAAS